MKEKKGITLIALIVTVIIMIILAAVSIRIITSGGIIDKTRQAAIDTIYEQDHEEFLLAVAGARDYFVKNPDAEEGEDYILYYNVLDVDALEETLAGWTITSDGTNVTATSPNNNTFKALINEVKKD